jgi:hypothetical protein
MTTLLVLDWGFAFYLILKHMFFAVSSYWLWHAQIKEEKVWALFGFFVLNALWANSF